MNSNESSKTQDFSETNGHVKQNKQNDTKKLTVPKKVYIHRNSVLTDLMEVNHLQSIYNIAVAICFLLFLNAIIFYLVDPPKLWEDLNTLKWGASKFSYFVMFWLLFNLFAFAVYEGFKLWIVVRNRINSKVADGIFVLLYVASLCITLSLTAASVLEIRLPPICAFATTCEQVRICMKIHSFVRESTPRVIQYKPQKDGNQQLALYPPRRHYLYYLFAPTLIYRDSYPRTEKRHWGNAFYNLYKFCLVIFITYCVFMRFHKDLFKNVGLQPFSKKEAALIFAGSMASGCIMMFMMFYGILHCWLNATAELLRFGDREFYQDWWNSTSFTQYYRRWNLVVHDWLHAYIYTDSQKLGCSRSFSMVLVFVLSAVFHEYIISLSFGYFYPVLLVVYSTIGISVVFITKQRTSHYWNIFMWAMLFAGWGQVLICYTTEWYARVNCPKQVTGSDFLRPRSLDPSCRILDFL